MASIDARTTFEFDLNGYVVLPGALDRATVARLNAFVDASPEAGRAHKFHFLDLDPAFLDLLAHPTVEAMCASWLHAEYRFDHAFGVQHFAGERDQRESLHGGPWAEQGFFQYHWHAGAPRCTSLLFGFALEPQRAGDGGLIVVPVTDAAAGESFAASARGVVEFPKAPGVALTLGQSANWLGSAGHVLGAAGDFVLGRVVRAAAASDARVRVVLAGP